VQPIIPKPAALLFQPYAISQKL